MGRRATINEDIRKSVHQQKEQKLRQKKHEQYRRQYQRQLQVISNITHKIQQHKQQCIEFNENTVFNNEGVERRILKEQQDKTDKLVLDRENARNYANFLLRKMERTE